MARIAILTTFQEFNPWYSLTGIVKDQIKMLTEYGNEVFLIVNEKFKKSQEDQFNVPDVTLLKILPFAHLHDYQNNESLQPEHEETVKQTTEMLLKTLVDFRIDNVFTHDIIFTGWNKPYALGIQAIGEQFRDAAWMHWIHSIPSAYNDWWDMGAYGPNHKLIYPNKTDALRVAENYRTTLSSVRTIPHIKDLRLMFGFDEATNELIDYYPALMQNDIVQIYPASSDRFDAKRVETVIKIFAFIKSLGHSVCLLIANQWATTQKHYADLQEYYKLGKKYGLEPGKDLIFSSLFKNHDGAEPYKVGVPSKVLFQLMQLSNLFIFPTDHETFGLVLPEVALSSGALCVLNKSLLMQLEVSGMNTIFFDFGSYTHTVSRPPEQMDDFLKQVAMIILGRLNENDGILTRTFMRKTYNYDSLYAKYYAPVMAEIRACL